MACLVTVVIPCHNAEYLVGRAIKSVLSQTYQQTEILLIENNSTDSTFAVLKEYEAQYPDKITVYAQEKKGACAARNLGISKAKGDWIQFLDADDELLPPKIEKQIALGRSNDVDIVADDYCKIRTVNGKVVQQHIEIKEDPWLGVINSRLGITSSNLWKKDTLLKVNGWNEDLSSSQEYDMIFRLLKAGAKVTVNHQVQTIIHAQADSISRTVNTEKRYKQYRNRYDLRCRIYEYLYENNLLNQVYKRDLCMYLYYHLLLIRELNIPFFESQVDKYDFQSMSMADRVKVLVHFIRNSFYRKHGFSNIFLKTYEWNMFFMKYIYLLKF